MRPRWGLVTMTLLALIAAGCASQPRATEENGAALTGSGTTMTGEVVSFTASGVTVATAGGSETLQLDGDTQGREHLMVGRQVNIEALLTGGSQVARRIEPAVAGG